jgi:hypothetical protein
MRFRTGTFRITKELQLRFLLGKYEYQPLPSPTCIRLLQINPASVRGVIQCSLKTYELQESPRFQALSYTWGDSRLKLLPNSKDTLETETSQGSKFRSDSETPKRSLRRSIICDGRLIRVTNNLREALLMLAGTVRMPHTPETPRHYWIDYLSMDQSNISERNDQVERMGDVFRKADSVVVWLGKDDDFTIDALQTMRVIAATTQEDWPLVPYTSFYEPGVTRHAHRPHLSFYNWLGFMALINRPWFRRAWVVQEIALAKSATVVCGKHIFSWEILSKTLSFIKTTKWYHHLQTEKMRHVATLQKQPGVYKRVLCSKLSVGISPIYLNETRMAISAESVLDGKHVVQPPPLRILLDKHRFASSTDPRDKVYALIGLADRSLAPFRKHPSALIPDYNLSVQEVYTETARVFMTSYESLALLSHVEDASVRRTEGLPSWVADLSVPLDPYPLRFRGPGRFKAAGQRRWRINSTRMAQGLLDVQGYQLDYIDETSILLDESVDPSASWASIVKLTLALNMPYPDPSKRGKCPSRVEILWRTLTTDVYAHTHPAPLAVGSLFIDYILNLQIRHRLTPWSSSDAFQPHHSPLSDSIYPEWRTLLGLEPSGSRYSLAKYQKRLASVVESMFDGSYSPIELAQLQHELDQSGGKKRRVFKTRGGYLGTGPRSLRQGDEVWILHRAGMPFVLRPQSNGNYRLIGEAFVYGVMHSEALQLGLEKQHITIE